MIQMDLKKRERPTDLESKLMVAGREWLRREFGKVMYTLLYSKWIINKDILYSTWKSTHSMCQPGWEGGWGRMDTCMCMAESLCCSPETATTLLISYTPIQNNKFKVWKKKRKEASFTSTLNEEIGTTLQKHHDQYKWPCCKLHPQHAHRSWLQPQGR